MLSYKAIEIFTSEETRYRNKPIAEAVMQYIRDLKIAARCIVTRGIAGCYESGEVATRRLEILSFNLPIRIYIVLPEREIERVLTGLDDMVVDGIVALHDLKILSHRTHNAFFPRQLMVRDVMTVDPLSVTTITTLKEVANLLLSSIFTGLPVVDEQLRPIGVITQGDLIRKGGLPLRLGLLAESDEDSREEVLKRLVSKRASGVMTMPAVIISESQALAKAVDLMLTKGVKRLPVVDGSGRLTGMLSRLDIFRTVMRESPDWSAFREQKIEVAQLNYVGDILRRDAHSVLPETTLNEVIQIIDDNDIQRVAVVDAHGKLLGMISDRDLLCYFKTEPEGIWPLLAKIKHPFKHDDSRTDLHRRLEETKAAVVMTVDLIKVTEDMLVEEAIELMINKELKRLPVTDATNQFKGMISRDSLLRTGFGLPV